MAIKFAFAGFRHPHVFELYNRIKNYPEIQVTACCEEDADARERLISSGAVENMNYSCISKMIKEADFDVICIGDYFTRRGSIAIQALKAGKHVLVDKPVCTSLEDLDEIERLSAENNLKVGCQFTMREELGYQTLRKLVMDGTIGRPNSVIVTGMHPLNIGSRPQWFFMPGCHGGTIIDIGVHVFDIAEWLTGSPIKEFTGARSWNAKAKDYPWFEDSAQFMFSLESGCGVMADVSYLAPQKCGYSVPQYWRCQISGDNGLLEYQHGDTDVMVVTDQDEAPRRVKVETFENESYLDSFLADIRGDKANCKSDTADVIAKTRLAIKMQMFANSNK